MAHSADEITHPQARLKALVGKGLQKPGDVEAHLGKHAAEYPN